MRLAALNEGGKDDEGKRGERHETSVPSGANSCVIPTFLPIIPLIIVNFQLPIADLSTRDYQLPIGNWQLAIGNALSFFRRP